LLFNAFRLTRAAEAADDDDESEVPPVAAPAPSPDITAAHAVVPVAASPTPRLDVHRHAPPAPVSSPLPRVDVVGPGSVAPITPASLGWLHLTDLHQGMGGASWLWPNVRAQMFADLEKLHT